MAVGKCQSAIYIFNMRKPQAITRTVVIIGYGSQGRAIALNLRDSGYSVAIGLRPRSRSRVAAKKDGFEAVHTIAKAIRATDPSCICFAFPDHLHGRVYEEHVRANLPSNKPCRLLFLHGMSVHFGMVRPPSDCDIILLAPHAPGDAVREKYLGDRSLSAFYGVHRDVSGHARRDVIELAQAIGFDKKRLIATTFEDEAVGDLFGEQAVLCGGLAMLVKTGFEVLIEKGLPPENAYLEVAYQLDLIVEMIKKHGVAGMLERISVAARYGSVRSGPQIVDKAVKERMEKVYDRIRSGEFARQLGGLDKSDVAELKKAARALSHPLLEKAARKFAP